MPINPCKNKHEIDRVLVLFLTQYYHARLQNFEQLDIECCTTDKLFKVAEEASALYKFLADSSEERSTCSAERIVSQTDAYSRLQQVMALILRKLNLSSEPEHFYLCTEPVHIGDVSLIQFEGGQIFELLEYINHIHHQSDHAIDIRHCFNNTERMQHWQHKTQVVMTEMVGFLLWVLQRLRHQPQMVPVPFLRDTLVVHLGLKVLQRYGIYVNEPKPILWNRKFLNIFEGGEYIYDALNSDIFYGILYERKAFDLNTLRHQFSARAKMHPAIPTTCIQAIRDYIASLTLNGSPLMIESGMHGTFPLWLLSLLDNVGDMVLYTAVPWLYSLYKNIVFRQKYNYLRDVETILAHEQLFQFSAISGGNVFVVETPNDITKALSLYELYLFKKLLKQKIHKVC